VPEEKSLETLPENWCCEICREPVLEIGGGNWEGPPADSSKVVRWNNLLVGGG